MKKLISHLSHKNSFTEVEGTMIQRGKITPLLFDSNLYLKINKIEIAVTIQACVCKGSYVANSEYSIIERNIMELRKEYICNNPEIFLN